MTDFSRRTMLASAAGVASLGLTGNLAFLPAAHAADVRKKGFYSYKVGDIEVISIYDGIWNKAHAEGFVIGSTVEEVTKTLQSNGHSGENIPIEFAFTVLKTGNEVIMVDAGIGKGAIPTAGAGAEGLAAAGIKPEDVTKIIVTHLHPDHIFGLYKTGTNELIYKNAEIIIGEDEFKFWADPAVIAKLPERRKGLAGRIQATLAKWDNVSQVKSDQEVAPGIRSVDTPGHTPGHIGFHLSSGNEQLLLLGDLIIVPALFLENLDWQLAFDFDKDIATTTRKSVIARAVADNLPIAGHHFGFPNSGKIEKDGNGYVFKPVSA